MGKIFPSPKRFRRGSGAENLFSLSPQVRFEILPHLSATPTSSPDYKQEKGKGLRTCVKNLLSYKSEVNCPQNDNIIARSVENFICRHSNADLRDVRPPPYPLRACKSETKKLEYSDFVLKMTKKAQIVTLNCLGIAFSRASAPFRVSPCHFACPHIIGLGSLSLTRHPTQFRSFQGLRNKMLKQVQHDRSK